MDILGWNDNLSTGFAEIDADHKSLFDYINVLENAVSERRGREMSKGVLGALLDYAKYHFSREEAIFTKAPGYQNVADHLEQHRKFVAEMEKYSESLSSEVDVSADMAVFLSEWLVRHIMTVDKAFFATVSK